jgi:hypothetical protein
MAWSVEGLTTDWTVRGSNPGGGVFSNPVHSGPGAHPAYYIMGIGALYQGYNGRGVTTTHPFLPPRVKIGTAISLLLP